MPPDQNYAEHQAAIEASFARNASAMVGWEAVWGLGAACCLNSTVVPAYLLSLGASKTLVQVVALGFSLATGLQILSARIAHSPRRKAGIIVIWALYCCCWLAYGSAAALGWGLLSMRGWILLFAAMCAGLAATMHLGSPPYGELVLENIPRRRQGWLAAMRNFFLGLSGVAGACFASWLMKQWNEPVNFHCSFVIGSSIMLVSCLTILPVRDHAYAPPSWQAPPVPALKAAGNLLRSFNFRVFLVFYTLVAAAQTLGPLLISYGRDVIGISTSEVAQFSGAYFIGAIVVGTLVSPLADRHGFRLIAIISCALLATAFLLPLLAGSSRSVLLAAYILYSGSIALNFLVMANLGAELVPEVKPATILAVGSTLTVPVTVGVAPLSGQLVDVYGPAGYLAVLVMGATVSLCALIGFALLVREPRTGQEIYIRIRPV